MRPKGFPFKIIATLVVAATATFAIAETSPPSGVLSPANPTLTFTGGPFALSNPSSPTGDNPPVCTEDTCGQFVMTVAIPAGDFNSYRARVAVGWTNDGTTTLGGDESDFDVYIYAPDLTGTQTATAASLANPEVTTFDVSNGDYTIYVDPFDVSPTVTFEASVSLIRVAQSPWPEPSPLPALPPGTPRFFNYHAPPGVAEDAGEPSIGVNWRTERVFGGIPNGGTVNYFGGFLPYMLSVVFDDRTAPATTTWTQAPLVVANAPRLFGDPILFTDPYTGRTFVSQEMGLTPLGSTMEFTDSDGAPFTPSEGSGAPSGIDHQTVGGGPYHQPIPTQASPLYPHGVWYCSQSVADAVCSISLDGGLTFGPAIPMYSVEQCSGLHGHIKIGPDGTAFVPNRACGGSLPFHSGADARQAVVVSEDNGITWDVREIPTATTKTDRDPSVAVATDGTLYFAYQAADGHSRVAVSRDKGLTWINDSDVGSQVGVQNSLFHAAVAGDPDRAAVAFFGTETGGDGYNQPDFPGVWYLYVATTFDGGLTWTTQNITPGDPVQRGGICGDGACRNLLDFFGAEIDRSGRVLVGYDDGCISANCISGRRAYGLVAANDFTAKAVIARQASGKRMFADWDATVGPDIEPPLPPPPPPAPTSCDGLVAADPAGDADHPLLHENGGSLDSVDITALRFALSEDGQSLVTTIELEDFSTEPVAGSLGAYYYATWTSARRNEDGSVATRNYATRAATSVTGGVTFRFGQYDQSDDSFVGTPVTVEGSYVIGPGGSVSVVVPLSLLGDPTIPVTDANSFPATIEPYAVAIIHEQAVRFVQPADRAPNVGHFGASWAVCPVNVTSIEDDHASVEYSQGWHRIDDPEASQGHFRLHTGNSPNGLLRLVVDVPAGQTGKIAYHYATSPKGGSAELFVDGVSHGVVTYAGGEGKTRTPAFGSRIEIANLAAGAHVLELRNMRDAVYVDRFSLENSASAGSPQSGPGATSASSGVRLPGETSTSITVPADATSISVVAESTAQTPLSLVLVAPNGLTLATADNSSGFAVIEQPVAGGGVYLVKVVNLSLGPIEVWTAATPEVPR